jgi:predicted N-acyltransferase
MSGLPVSVRVVLSVAEIGEQDWDACACPEAGAGGKANDPFTRYRFLRAWEESGSVGPDTGWYPHHLVAARGDEIIGVAPCYLKSHSQGEYVFDHSWADAYTRAGGQYYPKLQLSVPFTPVTGRRFLVRAGDGDVARAALLEGAMSLARSNTLSSLHMTFCTGDEAGVAGKAGLLTRIGQQFHWVNAGYKTFDDFLMALSSRKRKNIRRERAKAHEFGGEILAFSGEGIAQEHLDAMWMFYQDTGARKWGTPYLHRRFFDLEHVDLRQDMYLVLARRNGKWIAGALNFIGADTLYGRYWGCTEHHPALHFELCYYRAIEYAIEHGLSTVEAGAQGEHKLARGYLPVRTHSAHWIANDGFRDAVSRFLDHERDAVDEDIEILNGFGPFRRD